MWLIGMMGSGKTTIGKRAASRLDVPFYDTDDLVVESAKRPVSSIWDEVGEDGFRELERDAVASVPTSNVIAAAGGGAVLDPANRAHMSAGAPVIWLSCPPEELAERLASGTGRPLLEGVGSRTQQLTAILETRLPLYQGVATDTIETGGLDPDQVVESVIEIWQR